jgi:hypothetical protein
MMETFYIDPALAVYENFTDTLEKNDYLRGFLDQDKMQDFNLSVLDNYACLFIIGEPGYGKSLLIDRLHKHVDPGKTAIRIDCREFIDTKKKYDFTGSTHIYFDGLDEVPSMLFLESLNRIRSVQNEHPTKKIFIACRTHYIKRFEVHVKNFKESRFLQLKPFQELHIRNYLRHFLSDHEVIDAIVYKSVGQPGKDSILKTPRYLAALVKSIQEEEILPEAIKTMSRTDIFERVIYCQLLTEVKRQGEALHIDSAEDKSSDLLRIILDQLKKQESRKLNLNEIELTKRVLEKLAFIMEIYQRNRITKTELITFLDETQSNITQIFLTNSSIDRFIERTLKSVEDAQLVFEHTEFQEYLAAKELVRLSDSPQVLYDLILEKDLQVIYSSWLDVLQYAIELDAQKVAGSLADYLKNNAERQTDERLIEILMGPGIEKADEPTKARLFAALYHNFQSSGKFLYQKNDLLAALYVPAANQAVMAVPTITEFNQDTIRKFVNQVLLVRSLSDTEHLKPELRQDWKIYLLACLETPELKGQYEVMLWALEKLDAATELRAMSAVMKTKPDEQLSFYMQTMGRLGGDEIVDFFIQLLRDRPALTGKDDFLISLTEKTGLIKIMTALITEPELIKSLFNSEYRFVTFYRLFDNIGKINDAGLDQLVEKLLFIMIGDGDRAYYSGRIKEFVDRALEYLLQKDPGFLTRLLQHPQHGDVLDISADAVSNVMTLEQFEEIYQTIMKDSWEQRAIYRIIGHLKIAGDLLRVELLTKIEDKYPELFTPAGTAEDAELRAKKEKERLSKELQRHLMPNVKVYSKELFSFYLNNRASLDGIIKPDEITYIKDRLTEIIDQVKPEVYRVQLDRNGNSTTFNMNYEYWFRFGHFIDAAMQLDLTAVLQRNRSKLIKYLPLMNEYMINENDRLRTLQAFLGEITDQEAQDLLDFCTNRTDDYIYSSAATFAKVISSYHLNLFKPILIKMLESEHTDYNEKKNALIAYGDLDLDGTDQAYFEKLFNDYDPKDALKKMLAEQANQILIARFRDDKAIKWRFDQLISRQKPMADHYKDTSARPYTEFEQELDRPTFAAVFDEMTEPEVQAHMEQLLRSSLEIRKKDLLNRYSTYLQMIVFNYYNRHNSANTLNRLRGILAEPAFKATAGSFKSFLRSLEINLSNTFELFQTISEPVKRYNEIKAKEYLKVRNQADLAALFDKAIEDLQDFITNKGYYSAVNHLTGVKFAKKTKLFNEDILQKTFQITIENSLLKRGIRDSDIQREVELFDAKRLDIVFKYGFIGPIMAELKLLNNAEILLPVERTKYKDKIKQYIAATKAEYSYYIVFKVEDDKTGKHQLAFDALVKEYADIPNLTIKLIDCPVK